jgi:hypothetical protein
MIGVMSVLIVFLTILGAGGLCYPRRPRLTGVVFMAAGGYLMTVTAVGTIGGSTLFGATWVALGLGMLWRFRDSAVRSVHVAEWTDQS